MIFALSFSVALASVFWQAPDTQGAQLQGSPSQLVSEVIANELKAQQDDRSLWCYRQIQRTDQGAEELEVVDTPEGSIHQVLKRDGQPLSFEDAGREEDRIRRLVENPKEFQKRAKAAEKDADEERQLLEMLPFAFEFRFSSRDGDTVKLDFSPRASFRPERREGQVFRHMVGSVFLRLPEKRLMRMQGQLVSEVKFFGGVLGYLAKDGTFDVSQSDVGGGHWEMTRLHVKMRGKALFFKTISVNQNEEDSDFRPVSANITIEEAAKILDSVEKPSAAN